MHSAQRSCVLFAASLFVGGADCASIAQQADPGRPIAVQIAAGLVYMPAQVNGSAPLTAVLDTGASLTILSPQVADAAGLKSTEMAQAGGIGKGADQTLHLLNDCELKWGDAEHLFTLPHQQAAILPIDYISAQVGKRADAIFGSNLFLHFTVTVDYEQQRVTFFAADAKPQGSAIPIQIAGSVPQVSATVTGEDGVRVTVVFLLDSGTSGAMVVSRKFLEAHPSLIAAKHFADSPPVKAVGGEIRSQRVRVPRLELGAFTFSDVVASVPEAASGVLSDGSIAGFIGSGVLSRFTVTWDYAHRQMFLSPNKTLQDPFETDSSGLHLISAAPDYRTAQIDAILPGSPAARAGLQPGDEIVAVNGSSGLPLWKISTVLRKAGTSPTLTIKRKDKILEVTLRLRSPL